MPKALFRQQLCAGDLKNLEDSGLTGQTIRANGLRTEGGALVIPYRDLDGRLDGFARRRPHDGKPAKYVQPKGTPLRAYLPVGSLAGLRDTGSAVFITEGEKKALALAQHGWAAVGIGGFWCGCEKNAGGGHELIDDLAAIDWTGRQVYIVFDWDPKESTRRDAGAAERRLAAVLRAAGAGKVHSVDLPPGPGDTKQGVDDYLVANGREAFEELVEQASVVASINAINVMPGTRPGDAGVQLKPLILPVLAAAAYHGAVGEFLRAVAPFTEATDAGVLAHLLPAAGTLIGPGPHVFSGTFQRARVNTVLVGPTSTGRKGTALAPVDILMRHANPEFWTAQRVGGLSTGEGLIAAVSDRREPAGDDGGEPPPTEKRLYVIEEEFSRVLAQARRDGNILSQVVREAFDGGDLSVLTRGSPLHARGAHIAITGHITPEELAARLSGVDQANGFGNRFLWFAVRSDKVLPRTTPIPEGVFGPLARRLRAVTGAAARAVPLSSEATELWEGSVYPDLRQDRPGLAGAMTARGAAFVLRVALIYSQLDEPKRRLAIHAEHLNAALAVWEYSRASCYQLFQSLTGTPLGDKLVQLLAAHGPMKKSQFTDHIGRPVHEIDDALAGLTAAGRVRKTKAKPSGPGRPAEVYELVAPTKNHPR